MRAARHDLALLRANFHATHPCFVFEYCCYLLELCHTSCKLIGVVCDSEVPDSLIIVPGSYSRDSCVLIFRKGFMGVANRRHPLRSPTVVCNAVPNSHPLRSCKLEAM